MRTRLKVCCNQSIHEAGVAIAHGADAVGLVAKMPTGPGPIPDELIADIAAAVPPPVATFLLTCETSPQEVVDHVVRTRVNTVQLVDEAVGTDVYHALRDQRPTVRIVQVIHVRTEASIDDAINAGMHCDAILLDSGNPDARELGGTGRVHDWTISREIVDNSPVPVFLAGGLTPENVRDAVRTVHPFGVDVCTGVRTDGRLDHTKLEAFVAAINSL